MTVYVKDKMISKEKAYLHAMKLKIAKELKDEEDIKLYTMRSLHQRELIKTIFYNELNEWYINYLAGMKKIPRTFSFIEHYYWRTHGVYSNEHYKRTLYYEFAWVIKNELLSFNKDLSTRGFRISDVKIEKDCSWGDIAHVYVSLCDVNSYNCALKCAVM